MAVFDVREDVEESITEIVFAGHKLVSAYKLIPVNGCVAVLDVEKAIFVPSAEDAQNLIKALNKAIELGWLK